MILLGGAANALSVARCLGKRGIPVYVLTEPGAFVNASRFAKRIPVGTGSDSEDSAAWAEFLLGRGGEAFQGAVLLSCSDAGLTLIADHRQALKSRFLLDESEPTAQRAMLDKLETYRLATEAGVPTPRYWVAQAAEELAAVRDELRFPVIVKPKLTHLFEAKTGKKLLVAQQFDELDAAMSAIAATGTESIVMELVPGPDDRLCSYYTYLDERSQPLFHFTKRIIRRYPVLRGTACYHITDHIPEAAELANRLFRHVGLRGLANVEFKLDERDGQLKLIECNARFTASNCLVASSGIDLALFVYNRLTGRPAPAMDSYRSGLRLWDPIRDFQAYLALRKNGGPNFVQWLGSVCHRQTFPYFDWADPVPAIQRLTKPIRAKLRQSSF